MNHSVWLYIMVMALVSYLLRVLPLTLIRKQIKNRFIKSLLYYLPYVTLAVMTVPAIFSIAENPLCGILALLVAGIIAWTTSNLFLSACVACITVFIIGMF